MDKVDKVDEVYDAYYYAHGCGRPYQRDAEWMAFFGTIADRIVEETAPRSALDAGCAMGFLVEQLRARDVEAFGIDISEYAISQAHPDVQPFLPGRLDRRAVPADLRPDHLHRGA